MKFPDIEHIFFDLDHTLWDFDKNSALTFETIFKKEALEICLEDFLEAYIPINNNYWKLYREEQISKELLRTGRLTDCFRALKMEVSAAVISKLSESYIRFLPNYNNLLEGTIEILDYLGRNYSLHIITNGFEEVQHLKMTNAKISPFFATVTTSEEVGVKKPHSRIFEKALEKAKSIPQKSLMIGDNFEADIEGALKVGMQALYFDYYQKREELQVPQIQKLKELKLYL